MTEGYPIKRRTTRVSAAAPADRPDVLRGCLPVRNT
jgi:hypothetical protein